MNEIENRLNYLSRRLEYKPLDEGKRLNGYLMHNVPIEGVTSTSQYILNDGNKISFEVVYALGDIVYKLTFKLKNGELIEPTITRRKKQNGI